MKLDAALSPRDYCFAEARKVELTRPYRGTSSVNALLFSLIRRAARRQGGRRAVRLGHEAREPHRAPQDRLLSYRRYFGILSIICQSRVKSLRRQLSQTRPNFGEWIDMFASQSPTIIPSCGWRHEVFSKVWGCRSAVKRATGKQPSH